MVWKGHKGLLIRRLVYLVIFAGAGVGLSFLTQKLWNVQWYSLFIPLAAVIALLGVYQTLTLCFCSLSATEDGVCVKEGIAGGKITRIPYRKIAGYTLSGDKLDEILGYVKVTVSEVKSVSETVDHVIALSPKDADRLFDILASEIAKAPREPKEIV